MKVRYVINIDTRLEKSRCSVQWCLYKIGKKIRILYISSTLRSYNELFFIIWYGTFTLDDVWWFIWDTQLMFSVVDTAIDSKCHVSKRSERRPWFSKEADSDRRLPFSVSSHIYIYIYRYQSRVTTRDTRIRAWVPRYWPKLVDRAAKNCPITVTEARY